MLVSMTGFAAAQGAALGYSWSWELRSVNAKGLDIRPRVPDWITGLEPALRKELSAALGRGSVNLGLRITRDETDTALEVNLSQLDAVLSAMTIVEQRAMDQGLSLAPSKASDIVSQRGILDVPVTSDDPAPICAALLKDFPAVLTAFKAMRAAEGAALEKVLTSQLDQIDALVTEAVALLPSRAKEMSAALNASLAKVLQTAADMDEARIAQEIAVLVVKSDITEEIDRLQAHVAAARVLLTSEEPVGRKFDFLMQEFNREANTLCSKSQNTELTRIGLDLKVLIDQMREQVQNVE